MEAQIKCVLVGDNGVGKTSLILTSATGRFPEEEFLPVTAREQYIDVVIDERPIEITPWDVYSKRTTSLINQCS